MKKLVFAWLSVRLPRSAEVKPRMLQVPVPYTLAGSPRPFVVSDFNPRQKGPAERAEEERLVSFLPRAAHRLGTCTLYTAFRAGVREATDKKNTTTIASGRP